MPTTILAPSSPTFPAAMYAPLCWLKRDWADTWQLVPELRVGPMSLGIGGAQATATISRQYGRVMREYETDFFARSAAHGISDWWVLIQFPGPRGLTPAWIGRIGEVDHQPHSASAAGSQSWPCYGPEMILQKAHVSRSYWEDWASIAADIGWVPDINEETDRGTTGNRSDEVSDDTGVYKYDVRAGSTWTYRQYIDYMLRYFVDESDIGGPSWTLTGQTDLLEVFTEPIRMRATQSVARLLADLIPAKYGVSYKIITTDAGFEIQVFALNSDSYTYGSITLPANPASVEIRTAGYHEDMQVHVGESNTARFGTIRILGKRAVICCSLWGELAYATSGLDAGEKPYLNEATLAKNWTDAEQTKYEEALNVAAWGDAADADAVRSDDQFRTVFQHFGAPYDWARYLLVDEVADVHITVSDDGQTVSPAAWESDYFQTSVRKTLSWIPLFAGYDYSVDPPVDNNPADHTPELLPLCVRVYDATAAAFLPVEELGVGLSPARDSLGIELSCSPHHLLAGSDFNDGVIKTEIESTHDFRNLVATLAFESDQRLAITFAMPGAKPSDGTLELTAPNAELWYLAPHTVVAGGPDIGAAGPLLKTSGPDGRVLRSDVDQLTRLAAGAIAQYRATKAHARLTFPGWRALGDLLGQILTVVDTAGAIKHLHSPITQIEWTGGDKPETIVSTGYAQ